MPSSQCRRAQHPMRACLALVAACLLPVVAIAQSVDDPPKVQRAHTPRTPAHHNKVLGGVERGTNAAGRSIERADSATRRGVDSTAERASRPVRRVGDAFGRKLGAHGPSSPPAVGPQGNQP